MRAKSPGIRTVETFPAKEATKPASDRRVCLMRDPIYRTDVLSAAMGYFQVPMVSYDMVTGMK